MNEDKEPTNNTELTGSGAIAQGDNAVSVGERGVYVDGDVNAPIITGDYNTVIYTQPHPLTSDEIRVRRVLLNKVQTFWVEGVLEKSLHHVARIELELEYAHDTVERPACACSWPCYLLPQGKPSRHLATTGNQRHRAR